MAGLINSTTTFINDAYDYYLWTLSLAGMTRFFFIIIFAPKFLYERSMYVCMYVCVSLTNFQTRRREDERMAAGRLAEADPAVHAAVPVHRVVGPEDHEAAEGLQAHVGPRALQPGHGPPKRLHSHRGETRSVQYLPTYSICEYSRTSLASQSRTTGGCRR